MSKIAAAVLAGLALTFFSIPMSAQLIPSGNVYGGVSYGQLTNATIQQSYRGWNGSAEAFPFKRLLKVGVVVDASGFYRTNATRISQYNFLGGLRLSTNVGKWRPFVHGMAGIRRINSGGFISTPLGIDVGGGLDYKLPFKNFSWRVQADYLRSHYLSANQNDFRTSTGIVWRF